MAGGGGSLGSGEPEFQVAPMIDVLLTILVFFMMITSAQVLKIDSSIKLPVAVDAIKKDNRSEIIINIRWDADAKKPTYVVDDKSYNDVEECVAYLAQRRGEAEKNGAGTGVNPPFRALLRGDRECPVTFVSKAMNACAEAGITDISFSALNKAG